MFRNVCVKPNTLELDTAVPEQKYDHPEVMERDAAHRLSVMTNRTVFTTRGEAGVLVIHDGRAVYVPAYPVTGPIDICGAGDSCSAAIACAMTAGCSPEEAAAFGNLVASITIQQLGVTGTASPEQVRTRWVEVGTENDNGRG